MTPLPTTPPVDTAAASLRPGSPSRRVAAVDDDAGVQIFRVIVRGRFGPLDPLVTAGLLADLEGRDELASYVFTKDGTLTYDKRFVFWSYRVEVRVDEDSARGDAKAVAFARAQDLATGELDRRGAPWRDVRVSGTNMVDVWS